jgi:lipoprotein-anchoring transpeptidase ErfK/SrfK
MHMGVSRSQRRCSAARVAVIVAAVGAVLALADMPAAARQGGKGSAASSRDAAVVEVALPYPRGSIVIVNEERNLNYLLGGGCAIRYPVANGRPDEVWIGRTFVSDKKENPRWVPVDGDDPVEGGSPDNPLGKRALYLDWSLLRIHGTNAPRSIGRAASSGCVRMFNEHVIDLYERVHIGAPVIAIGRLADAARFEVARITGKRYPDE